MVNSGSYKLLSMDMFASAINICIFCICTYSWSCDGKWLAMWSAVEGKWDGPSAKM